MEAVPNLRTIVKCIKYSWATWLAIKLVMNTYFGEETLWIHDLKQWIHLIIHFVILTSLKLAFLIYSKPLWETFFFDQSLYTYLLYMLDLVEPPISMIQDICVKTILFLNDTFVLDDIGILLALMFASGDMAIVYREHRLRNIYRKVRRGIENRSLREDMSFINIFKWKRLNPNDEIENYIKVRSRVMDFISKTDYFKHCADFEDVQIKGIEYVMRDEMLKLKNFNRRVEHQPNTRKEIKLQPNKKGKKQTRKERMKNDILNNNQNDTPHHPVRLNAMSTPDSARVCWTCLKPDNSLLKCSGCMKARYCGEACYREDWARHGDWCKKKRKKREQKKMHVVQRQDEVD